jgi:hypothetical protein
LNETGEAVPFQIFDLVEVSHPLFIFMSELHSVLSFCSRGLMNKRIKTILFIKALIKLILADLTCSKMSFHIDSSVVYTYKKFREETMKIELVDEVERAAKRKLYQAKIQILEGYLTNVKQAKEDLDIGKRMYRSAHTAFVTSWEGDARKAFDSIANELMGLERNLFYLGEELLAEINSEIRKLQRKVDMLR